MNFFLWLSFAFLGLGLFLNLFVFFIRKKNQYQKEMSKKMPRICVLIPARNESKVIEGLLESLENQTHKLIPKNIYVIVESLNDPTVEIVKRHRMSYFVRQNLQLKTKGYALAEMIEALEQEQNYYDMYFIFDADNVLEPHFISEMVSAYQKGYALSTGYRALKNKNHYVSVSAWLTFLLLNDFKNTKAMKHHGNILFSGTGYYIHGDYIKKWKTFPFHSLTEDYECSIYCTLHGVSTYYNPKAIFYDEQPTSYRTSVIQRSRWIKGYMQNWLTNIFKLWRQGLKKDVPNRGSLFSFAIGISPIVCWILSFLLLLIFLVSSFSQKGILMFFLFLLILYLCFFLLTSFLLKKERKHLRLSKKVFYQTVFYHPLFLGSYLHAFLKFLFHKDLGWSVIEHKEIKKN